MTEDEKPIRKETLSWLSSQLDRQMTDPDVLETMPREAVYEALGTHLLAYGFEFHDVSS